MSRRECLAGRRGRRWSRPGLERELGEVGDCDAGVVIDVQVACHRGLIENGVNDELRGYRDGDHGTRTKRDGEADDCGSGAQQRCPGAGSVTWQVFSRRRSVLGAVGDHESTRCCTVTKGECQGEALAKFSTISAAVRGENSNALWPTARISMLHAPG